jgi:hypothetical protein
MGTELRMRGFRRPPKFQCTMCGRMFKGRKSRDNHILYKQCKRTKDNSNLIEQSDPEVLLMKSHQYQGREYNYNPIPTGNRHYRTGIPLPRFNTESNSRSAM